MGKIADISHYQNNVNWAKAAAELDLCILRATVGSNADKKYAANAQGCRDNGIPFGAYHYLKAKDTYSASVEANWFFRQAEPEKPLFYVVDCEYGGISSLLKKDLDAAKDIVSAFLSELRTLAGTPIIVGCYIGHHLYKSWALNYKAFDFIWIPRYGKNSGQPEVKPAYSCDLWQYTSKGSLAGVSSRVDLNQLMGSKPLSFFTQSQPTTPDTQPVTDTGDDEEGGTTMSFDPKKVLEVAIAELGYLEKASNSNLDSKTANAGSRNYTKYARDMDAIPGFYNGRKQAVAWCDVFVDWCFVQAYGVYEGRMLLCQPLKSCGAGCRYSRGYYKSKGQLYDTPKAGDQIFFWPSDRSNPNAVQHTGIVEKVDGTYVHTIEGNTSGASGVVANGGGVCRKKYKLNYARIAGFGRPNYGQELSGDPQDPAPTPTAYKLGERSLKKGNDGSDVVEMQQGLVKLGFDLGTYGANKDGADGDFGAKTDAAVRAFQTQHNLTVDGVFGAKSFAVFKDALEAIEIPAQPPQTDPVYTLTITGTLPALTAIQAEYGGVLAATDAVTVG